MLQGPDKCRESETEVVSPLRKPISLVSFPIRANLWTGISFMVQLLKKYCTNTRF
jgi:hypothetical protein